jgi:hypothetical protein
VTLLRYALAATVGVAIVVGAATEVLNPWWVALMSGGGGIVLLPRHPRLVGAAVLGAAVTMLSWLLLWTASWQSM